MKKECISFVLAGTMALNLSGCGFGLTASKSEDNSSVLETTVEQGEGLTLEEQIEMLNNEKTMLESQTAEPSEEKLYDDNDVYVVTATSTDGVQNHELVTLESKDMEIVDLLPYLENFSNFFKNDDFYIESTFLGVQEKHCTYYYSVFDQRECGYSVRLRLTNNSKDSLRAEETKDYVVGFYDYYNFGEESNTTVNAFQNYKSFFSETVGDSTISIQPLAEIVGIENSSKNRTISELQSIKDTLNKTGKVLLITQK